MVAEIQGVPTKRWVGLAVAPGVQPCSGRA